MSFEIKIDAGKQIFQIPIYGTHNIYNALSAIAVSHHLGFTIEEMKNGLKTFKRPHRRLTVHSLPQGIRLIDDSFSSNPHALKAAIDVLNHIGNNHKVAVLGSMMELGNYSVAGHREVGEYLKMKGIDYIYTYGAEAVEIGKGAIASGFSPNKIIHFSTKDELHRYLVNHIQPGTTILIKGSHALSMDQTVDFLRRSFKV
ncbi:hypothetical protein J7E76_25670 [Bacillus sp. ISL-101]|nr:cyanophycin synthetase [Bacillus sp. ISL-101]MBT2632438.1 hypothetical protein [Bacillus sp. ISL-101]